MGRIVLRCGCVVLLTLLAVPAFSAAGADEPAAWNFKSTKANEAVRKYKSACKKLDEAYEQQRTQNRATLVAKLDAAVKEVTKAQDLDDAVAIRDTIKALRDTKPAADTQQAAKDVKRADEEPKSPVHCLAPEYLKKVAFLDYRNSTWRNDISGSVAVTRADEGYQVDFDVRGGYEHKLMVFPNEDVRTKKMIVSFEIKHGTLGLSMRPRDLAPRAAEMNYSFESGKRYTMELWFAGNTPNCLINGQPVPVQFRPDCYGYFGLKTSPRLSAVFYDLRFVPKKGAAGARRER